MCLVNEVEQPVHMFTKPLLRPFVLFVFPLEIGRNRAKFQGVSRLLPCNGRQEKFT